MPPLRADSGVHAPIEPWFPALLMLFPTHSLPLSTHCRFWRTLGGHHRSMHAEKEGPQGGLQLVGEDVSTCRLRVFLYFILLCVCFTP